MEDVAHFTVHSTILAEYVCPCNNLPLCTTCKLEHSANAGHVPENCKEVGHAIMSQRIHDTSGSLAKGLKKLMKEFEAGFLREIDRFQESCIQTDERCSKMRKLASDGRYAGLCLYAKRLPAGGAKSEAATGELNKRLLEIINTVSAGLKKVLSKFAAVTQHKPVFAAYKKSEVLVLKDGSYNAEEQIISAMKPQACRRRLKQYISIIGVSLETTSLQSSRPVFKPILHPRSKSLSAFYIVSSKYPTQEPGQWLRQPGIAVRSPHFL